MRKILTVLIFLPFIFYCGGPNLSTPEGLAESALDVLKSGQFENYAILTPSEADMHGFFAQVEATGKLSQEKVEKLQKELEKAPQEVARMLKKLENRYNSVRGDGISEGIKWEETTFISADYKIRDRSRYEITIKEADIYFNFSYKYAVYRIKLNNCIMLARGWLNLDGMRWRGLVKKVDKDADASAVSSDMADDSKLKITLSNIKRLGTAIMSYQVDYGFVPVAKSVKEIMEIKSFTPFYIKRPITKDGWDYDLLYKCSEDKQSYFLASPGRDGVFKGWKQQGQYSIKNSDDYNKDIIYVDGQFICSPRTK